MLNSVILFYLITIDTYWYLLIKNSILTFIKIFMLTGWVPVMADFNIYWWLPIQWVGLIFVLIKNWLIDILFGVFIDLLVKFFGHRMWNKDFFAQARRKRVDCHLFKCFDIYKCSSHMGSLKGMIFFIIPKKVKNIYAQWKHCHPSQGSLTTG